MKHKKRLLVTIVIGVKYYLNTHTIPFPNSLTTASVAYQAAPAILYIMT